MRKKTRHILTLSVVSAAASGIGFAVLGPFVTLYRIKAAVDQHDASALNDLVSFPELRASVKSRYLGPPDASGSLVASVIAPLRSRAVDFAVDNLVSPEAVSRVIYGRQVWTVLNGVGVEPSMADVLKRLRFDWGLSAFTLYVRNDGGQESRLLLARQGLRWRIADIEP